MNRLLSFVLLALVLCAPMEARRRWIPKPVSGGGGATPTWVKNIANGNVSDTTTYSFATTAAAGSGNTIVFPWATSTGANITAVSGGGLTWTIVTGAANTRSWGCVYAYAPSGLSSGTTISITTDGVGYGTLFYDMEEFSGVLDSGTPDTSNILDGNGYGTSFSCAVTTTQDNDLVFGAVLSDSTNTWSIGGSGYTVGTSPGVSFECTFYPVWKVISPQGSTDVGGTYSGAQDLCGGVVALKHQ